MLGITCPAAGKAAGATRGPPRREGRESAPPSRRGRSRLALSVTWRPRWFRAFG